ncbi:alkaline phosphatase [Puniceicoccaceae bacterium K14]|nr:alkaline phosphatase [Puniceicoccaceae bacterium K14]
MNSRYLLLGFSLLFCVNAKTAPDLPNESPEYWRESGKAAILDALNAPRIEKKAKNVILFIGDGMGISTVTASRILDGQLEGRAGEENLLSFEKFPYTALAKTYNTNQQTPDSAGTMTAMVTGVKTKAGFISVNQRVGRGDAESTVGNELFTLLEKAEIAGKSTGVVSTARITHATPASCYAHSPERNWEVNSVLPESSPVKDIAAQLIDFPKDWKARGYNLDGLEVAIGGGRASFFPKGEIDEEFSREGDEGARTDGRNLAKEWIDGYKKSAYVHDAESFSKINPKKIDHLLGLFESSHMEYEADREGDDAGEPSLTEMSIKAVDILQRNKKGYFLMIEAGRIDHAHHAGNAYRALRDAIEFSEAIQAVVDKVNLEETLIVVTADHSHVFTMAGYPIRGNNILGAVVGNDWKGEPKDDFSRDLLGKPYTTLGYANGPGYLGASDSQPEGFKTFPHHMKQVEPNRGGRPDIAEEFELSIEQNKRRALLYHLQDSCIPLGSETHGGEDVGVWAIGPYAHLLHGTIEQHVIYHLMDFALGLEVADPFTAE